MGKRSSQVALKDAKERIRESKYAFFQPNAVYEALDSTNGSRRDAGDSIGGSSPHSILTGHTAAVVSLAFNSTNQDLARYGWSSNGSNVSFTYC